MAVQRNRFSAIQWGSGTSGYRFVREQEGWDGNKSSVYPYEGYVSTAFGRQRNTANNALVGINAINAASLHAFRASDGIPSFARPAYNRTYARFREEVLGEKSQLGEAFAQWKSSLGMVHQRVIGLTSSAMSLKKGDFRGFLRNLSVKPKRRHRSKTKATLDEASGLWLEYWFGWSASLGDIYNSLDVMSRDYSPKPSSASGRAHRVHRTKTKYVERIDSSTIFHKIGGEVRVVNPNLFLLNQLGLANPVATAWQVMPFSFVADWFFDVENYLTSFTDWAGLDLTGAYSTHKLIFHDRTQALQSFYTKEWQQCFGYGHIRSGSIPQPLPNLQFTANLGSSLTRTASAVSLLTQTLLSLKR